MGLGSYMPREAWRLPSPQPLQQSAETVEKAKERAKGKAEEKAMVEDPAHTDA